MSLRRFSGMAIALGIALLPVATVAAFVAPPDAGERDRAPIADLCFTEYTGDNTTDFSSSDASAVRSAVAAVAPGGTVKVAGTCAGAVLGGGTTQVALVTKAITMIGGFVPSDWTTSYPLTQPTTIDAMGAGRVFFFSGVDGTVSNLVIQNGYDGGLYGGGGIRGSNALALTSITFLSNTTQNCCGGVLAFGALTLDGGLFQGNRALTGDGGGAGAGSTLSISATQFIGNSAGNNGGGAYSQGAATVIGALFLNNQASYFGGGLSAGGGPGADNALIVTETQFISNTAAFAGGGAMAFQAATLAGGLFQGNATFGQDGGGLYASDAMTLRGVRFVGNRSKTTGGGARAQGPVTLSGGSFDGNRAGTQGGGLYAYSSFALTSTLFVANTAVSGGGVYHYGGVFLNSESALLVNALFARNTAQSFGAAVYFDHPSTADVIHTTVASPTMASASAFFVGSGTIRITNTIVASHTTGFNRGIGTVFEDYTLFDAVLTPRGSGVLAGAHSFTGTAGFAAPAVDNYRLLSASSALDAGADAGVGTDFEGTTRPFGAGFDIGYDEWVPPRAYLPVVGR